MKLFFVWMVGMSVAYGQANEVVISGKVINPTTGKAIRARISYKSLPTGGLTGSFNDSTFRFSVFGTAKYQITAQADGFLPRTVLVDPRELGGRTEFARNIELTEKGKTFQLAQLTFEQGKDVIQPQSFEGLDELALLMNDNPKWVIQLEGHTDNQGSAEKNMELSEDRVKAVKKYLSGKGVDKDRIKTKAFGGTRPLTKDRTPEARAKNRRVEIRVLQE
jgi:outer membrane protein OmpA-like peptidoglycan-associated protein